MRDETCRICGKPEAGSNYCGFCGVEQTAAALAFHDVMREYHHVARRCVRRARTDRKRYADLMGDHSGRLPPLSGMVDRVVTDTAAPDTDGVSAHSGPMYEPLLRRLAHEALEQD